MKRLMIIVPCYNEQEILQKTICALSAVLESLIKKKKISNDSGILFVNDGSTDNTWNIIKNAFYGCSHISGLNLSGNTGHQNALIAGMETALHLYDMCITIDADLQDDISAIEIMVDKFLNGADIVYGVRSDRKSDSWFKRFTAQTFYRCMNLLGVSTVYNHADFRLLSAVAVDALLQYKERNLFLRGIVAKLGFCTDTVYYSRKERTAGKSKYPLKKMLSFAWEGISSFSVKPISFIWVIGLIIIICTLTAFAYTLCSYLFDKTIPGWTSLMISIWFLGGVQLFSIGIIGQYVGKTYVESKRRPRYHVSEFITK